MGNTQLANIWFTLVGLGIPKCTVPLLPNDDDGDGDDGPRATASAVCPPSGHLGYKTTSLKPAYAYLWN